MNILTKLLDTYNKGTKYNQLFAEYQDLAKTITTERKQFTDCINDLETENILMYKDLEELQLQCSESHIEPILDTFSLDTTITNLKKKVGSRAYKYPFNGDGKEVSIKYSLVVKDQEIVDKYVDIIMAKYNPETPLECVESVSKYFIFEKKPIYVSEKVDRWEPADEFLYKWIGDCDTTAITMHVLIKGLLNKTNNSEHYKRLYLHINDNYLEGHANNLWLHEDGFFYTIESTIDPKGTFRRKWLNVPLKYDSFYTNTRGIANLTHCTIGNGNVDENFL